MVFWIIFCTVFILGATAAIAFTVWEDRARQRLWQGVPVVDAEHLEFVGTKVIARGTPTPGIWDHWESAAPVTKLNVQVKLPGYMTTDRPYFKLLFVVEEMKADSYMAIDRNSWERKYQKDLT